MRLLGEALGASDAEFPAYALAKGRALLDEHVVGVDAALANLANLREALGLTVKAMPGEDDETLRLAGGRRMPLPGEQDAGTG